MATNPLLQAHKQAQSDYDRLGELFARLGDTAHPNTPIMVAYRNARRAMRDVLGQKSTTPTRLAAARDVLSQLRATVGASVLAGLTLAAQGGEESAVAQLDAYGLDEPPTPPSKDKTIKAAYAVVDASLSEQERVILAMITTGMSDELVVGDANRQGALSPAQIITVGTFWLAGVWWSLFGDVVARGTKEGAPSFGKQAFAALDIKTTECCLLVHGQVVPVREDFHLTGTPRFADYLKNPPFHHRCRTATALYLPEYDDGITAVMRASADKVLAIRASGGKFDQNPASAFA